MTEMRKNCVPHELRQVVQHLRYRRGMYIGKGFEALVAFLVGFSLGSLGEAGADFMAMVKDQVKRQYRSEFALFWPYYLLEEVAKGDEAYATLLVLDTLEAFLDSMDDAAAAPEECGKPIR